jgi:prepilin-type N-terminal cleavage/methylation domain-containing protein
MKARLGNRAARRICLRRMPSHGLPARARRRGFTLLEIMMAFTILLLGCVGVYAVFSVGLVAHKRAVDNTTAANLAGSVFDDIASSYGTPGSPWTDNNRNGVPDRAELDADNNGIDDWFEPPPGERPRYPIPFVPGYWYRVEYARSDELDQELFVTVRVYWRSSEESRSATFQRSVFIKYLPQVEGN